jgi:hypothetical protein
MRNMLRNGALACIAVLAAWALTEAAARALLGPPPFPAERVAVFSRPSWRHDAAGALRYAPRSTIRTLAVYGDRVEYDVTFRTNNLGFVDDRNYYIYDALDKRRIAFVGDSFTAGFHGGTPWVPRLREQVQHANPRVEIYNLGVGAAGLPNFVDLVRSADRELDFDEIVVLFITHDLYRPRVRVIEHDRRIHLCGAEESRKTCRARESWLLVMDDPEADRDAIFARIRASGQAQDPDSLAVWLQRNTYLGYGLSVRGALEASFEAGRQSYAERSWSRDELSRLREDFPEAPITFLQIPEKAEVARGEYFVDSVSAIRQAGFDYVSLLEVCDLVLDDYHRIDGHPHQEGYAKISECVAEALGLAHAQAVQ